MLLSHSRCSHATLPRSVGKGLADRAVAGLCVYWCSIERAGVREFMLLDQVLLLLRLQHSMQFCVLNQYEPMWEHAYVCEAAIHDQDLKERF